MIKIYLAGSCSSEQRTLMQKVASKLRENERIEVYCPFELKIPNAWGMCQEDWAYQVFLKDIEAIGECDIFLMITPGRTSSAGTNWEQGYAYAKNKYIIVVQYTNDNTSLMTYSSADIFLNSSKIDLVDDILTALEFGRNQAGNCYTTLT
jgi:nucleoside 2-deoxyribosyltransferase